MALKFIYRSPSDPTKVTKTVVFAGFTSGGIPQGRCINARGVDMGVRELTTREQQVFSRRQPEDTTFEMGKYRPYESLNDQVRRLGLIRPSAPSRRSGRGTPVPLMEVSSLTRWAKKRHRGPILNVLF